MAPCSGESARRLAQIAEKAIDALAEHDRIVTLDGVDVVGVQAVVGCELGAPAVVGSEIEVRYFRITQWDRQAKVLYLEPTPIAHKATL